MHRLQELVRLHRMGLPARQIATELGMGPNTERRYRQILADAGLLSGEPRALPELDVLRAAVECAMPAPEPPKHEVSSVAAWQADIERLQAGGAGPRAIYDWLRRERPGFSGSYAAIKRLCRRLGDARGPTEADVAIPVNAPPGEAQVDFGYLGHLYDPDSGRERKAWVFLLVLAHSRRMVARIVFDQSAETWIRLHVEAFEELGGTPTVIVPDNLKAAVVRTAFGIDERAALHRSYRELARHYGCRIDPAPPQSPEKKGRVEAGVGYLRRNFLPTITDRDVSRVAEALQRWVAQTANQRIHGTTGRRPAEAFERDDRPALLPLPAARYEPVIWKQALVHRDSHVEFGRRLYSVPWRFIGKQVWIRATPDSVHVLCDDVRIATHARRFKGGQRSTLAGHLPEHRAELGQRSRAYWEERAAAIDPEVLGYVRRVFDQDDALSMLRPVQAIVTHLEKFPPERAVAACRRADYYGAYRYDTVKRILVQGLDLQPLPLSVVPDSDRPTGTYRFARRLSELLAQPAESTDDPH